MYKSKIYIVERNIGGITLELNLRKELVHTCEKSGGVRIDT